MKSKYILSEDGSLKRKLATEQPTLKITILKRKPECFSMAIMRTDLTTLSLILQRAFDDIARDLARAGFSEDMKAILNREAATLASVIEQLDDRDLFCDNVRRTVIQAK